MPTISEESISEPKQSGQHVEGAAISAAEMQNKLENENAAGNATVEGFQQNHPDGTESMPGLETNSELNINVAPEVQPRSPESQDMHAANSILSKGMQPGSALDSAQAAGGGAAGLGHEAPLTKKDPDSEAVELLDQFISGKKNNPSLAELIKNVYGTDQE